MNESNYLTPELVEKMRASLNSLTEEKKLKLKKMLPLVDETQKQALQKMIIKQHDGECHGVLQHRQAFKEKHLMMYKILCKAFYQTKRKKVGYSLL